MKRWPGQAALLVAATILLFAPGTIAQTPTADSARFAGE